MEAFRSCKTCSAPSLASLNVAKQEPIEGSSEKGNNIKGLKKRIVGNSNAFKLL
jgi:hypothetical protein